MKELAKRSSECEIKLAKLGPGLPTEDKVNIMGGSFFLNFLLG